MLKRQYQALEVDFYSKELWLIASADRDPCKQIESFLKEAAATRVRKSTLYLSTNPEFPSKIFFLYSE